MLRKTLATAAIGSGLLVLIGLALVRRSLAAGSETPPRPRAASEAAALEAKSPEQSVPQARRAAVERLPDVEPTRARRHAEEDFWEDLGALQGARSTIEPAKYREKISAMTAVYLGLDPARAAVFDRTAAAATEEIGRAWKRRNDSIEALSDAFSRDERERKEQEIQEAYVAAKIQAVAPLESLLESTPRQEHFRQRLGEWLDAMR